MAQAIRGLCAYETHCVACHGAAAVGRVRWVNGLNPEPPYLLDATKRWSPSQLHWIVRNGIKMTGMPAWREEHDRPADLRCRRLCRSHAADAAADLCPVARREGVRAAGG